MNCDDAMLEEALCALAPSRLDPRLFGRLHDSLEHASARVESADATIETMLAAHRPACLTDALMQRFVDVIPSNVIGMASPGRMIVFRRYAAAAVIALVGAVAALLAPIGGKQSAATTASESTAPIIPLAEARQFVPAGYARGLSEARDEGVVWKDNAPHRVLRIVYTDTITLRNEAGEIVEVEQPRVEYIVVPKKID